MLLNRLSRPTAVGVASLVAAWAAVGTLGATAAHATALGSLGVAPAKGADTSGIQLTTSAACPESATNLIIKVAGSGFPAAGQIVVSNSPINTYQTTSNGGIVVPLSQTMRDYANTAGFTTLKGRYDFTLTCRAAFGSATYGDFAAPIWFTSNTHFQDNDPSVKQTTPPVTTPPTGTPKPTGTSTPTGTPTPTGTSTATGTPTPTGTSTATGSPSPSDTSSSTGSPSTTGTSATGGISGGSQGSSSGGSQGVSTDVSGGSSGGHGSMASTGSNAGLLGAGAAGLVLVGGSAVWWARRRGLLTFADASHR